MNPFSAPKSTAAIGAATLLLLAGCAAPTADEPLDAPRPVRTAVAQKAPSSVDRVFSGVVRSATRSRLAFQVPGRLASRPIDIGTGLERGDTVARLDPADFELRLDRAEASLTRARAQAREASAEFDRTKNLYADDNATRSQLDRATSALESARSAVVEAERAVELARRELGYTSLVASRASRVVDLFAEPGEILAAGQAIAAVVDTGTPLELAWQVPERAIGSLRMDQTVEARIPALSMTVSATISEIGAAPRDGGATFPVIARLDDSAAADRLLPGMAVDVRIALGEGRQGETERDSISRPPVESVPVLVPPEAVAGDPGGAFVFVVEAAGPSSASEAGAAQRTVERRTVDLGTLRPEGLEIVSGLEAGEVVVAAGVIFLDDGQEVELLRGNPLGELATTAPVSGAER